jgi:hypothetical protein
MSTNGALLEVAVASAVRREVTLEIAVGAAVVRCEVGADVSYVAALVRALQEGSPGSQGSCRLG